MVIEWGDRMSYNSKEEVFKRVIQHYGKTRELGYDIVGVFLQGSWNYNLVYDGSDVDTKAIVLPSLRIFVRRRILFRIPMF